jgi:hypothetical protein
VDFYVIFSRALRGIGQRSESAESIIIGGFFVMSEFSAHLMGGRPQPSHGQANCGRVLFLTGIFAALTYRSPPYSDYLLLFCLLSYMYISQ